MIERTEEGQYVVRISDRLWRLNIQGAVAVANMICVVAALIAVRRVPLSWPYHSSLEIAAVVLMFPLGVLAEILFNNLHGTMPVATIVAIPLNAYLWGAIGAKLFGHRK
jgi:hypothetical protein